MKINKLFLFCLMASMNLASQAQTSITELRAHLDLASGNYCNYPNPSGHVTPAPTGCESLWSSWFSLYD